MYKRIFSDVSMLHTTKQITNLYQISASNEKEI